jgi:hypothetical protein
VPVRLRVVEGPNAGTVYFFGEGDSKVLGRSSTADITIPDPLLSRHHLMVRGSAEGALLLDLDSSNGTFVNDRLVRERHLASGDKIKIGNVLLEAEVEGRAPLAAGVTDKVATVRALMFCTRCMRAVQAASESAAGPWEPFVCDACRRGGPSFAPDVIEGYRLLEKIGDAPDGPVYKAEQRSLGRPAVVRFFAPSGGTVDSRALEQFLREATLAGRLSHPNIVETIDAGERGGLYFIVEESLEGGDLAARLRPGSPRLSVDEALSIAAKVAAALEYAFAQGIVHRNVRPSSIYLGPYGVVKLGDFGLAKSLAGRESQSMLVKTADLLREANYLSPEQLAQSANVDQRADVYSLGATLYHMACGAPPFDAPSPLRVVRRIGEGDLAPIASLAPDAPKPLRALIERCMEREPGRRYQTPRDVLAAIEQARAKIGLPQGR